jgi:hypothetical protein
MATNAGQAATPAIVTVVNTCAGPSVNKARRRRPPPMPRQLRRDIAGFAKTTRRKYAEQFARDPTLKVRSARLLRTMLPPRPRRGGRPGNEIVTEAIFLYQKFRKRYPTETPRMTWSRVCPAVIPEFDQMTDLEQQDARGQLQQRVAWRRRSRRRRKKNRPRD